MNYEKGIDYQDVANFNKRNIYIYTVKNSKQEIVSFFEYKSGDLYGGKKEIEKLVKTYEPKK